MELSSKIPHLKYRIGLLENNQVHCVDGGGASKKYLSIMYLRLYWQTPPGFEGCNLTPGSRNMRCLLKTSFNDI